MLAKGDACKSRLEMLGTCLLQLPSTPLVVMGKTVEAGVSLGVACMPDDADTTAEMLQMADVALYKAKEDGRGRLCVVDDLLRQSVSRQRIIEEALRADLDRGEGLTPVFQKQTCAVTKQVTGFEALARWHLPDGAVVPPDEFIAIVEESGLIEPLTRRILLKSCEFACELAGLGFEGRIAVNASPLLFDGTIMHLVADAMDVTGCEARMLEMEITEQVVLSDRGATLDEIRDLRALGVTVAFDDFGMGYSSLSYLQRFPVDKIKIDRAFVGRISKSPETLAIIQAIVDLSRALGMRVTAEGAETSEDRHMLEGCGVDTIQDWIDGKPMTRKQILEDTSLLTPAHQDQALRSTG